MPQEINSKLVDGPWQPGPRARRAGVQVMWSDAVGTFHHKHSLRFRCVWDR